MDPNMKLEKNGWRFKSYHKNWRNKALAGGELLRIFRLEIGKVKAHALQEIGGLTDIHPESWEFHGVKLTLFRHFWKDFGLYRGWLKLKRLLVSPVIICREGDQITSIRLSMEGLNM